MMTVAVESSATYEEDGGKRHIGWLVTGPGGRGGGGGAEPDGEAGTARASGVIGVKVEEWVSPLSLLTPCL